VLTCREMAQQQASDYLDKQLTVRQRIGFRLHLLLCRNCRHFMRQFRQVRRVLLAHEPEPVDEAIVEPTAEQLLRLHQTRDSHKK
jgi:hypothetical protein